MKKTLCILLCLLMALPCAGRTEDTAQTDIAALMARQVSGNSTLRAQLTAEFSQQAPSLIDAELWKALGEAAADTALEGTYVFSRAGETLGNAQAALYVKRGGETRTSLYLNGRGQTWQLWGDAVGEDTLLLPRDTSLLFRDPYLTLAGWGSVLLRGLGFLNAQMKGQREGEWPTLYRFLTQAATETDAWKERVDALLQKYTDQVSAWMQKNTDLYLVKRGDGKVETASEMKMTGGELADEALALLDMLYKDTALLSLLREKMTSVEARSYLEPGMILLFRQTLMQMELPGEMLFKRSYDPDGALRTTVLRLPLADGAVLGWELADDVPTYSMEKGDFALRLSVTGRTEESWQGRFTLRRGETSRSGEYQLFASMEPVYEDEDQNGRERRQNGTVTLLIAPAEGQDFSAQTLTLTVAARAGLENDRPAHWNAEMDWQEAGSGAYAHIALKTRTGAALQQQEPAGEAIDLMALEQADRGAALRRVLKRLRDAVLPAEEQ